MMSMRGCLRERVRKGEIDQYTSCHEKNKPTIKTIDCKRTNERPCYSIESDSREEGICVYACVR